jgi:hypothetical protein
MYKIMEVTSMKFVAVDADNGEAKIVHAKTDEEAHNKLVEWILNEGTVKDKIDAREIAEQEWDIFPIIEELP